MERSMIFFDIDGTLVPECTNIISDNVQVALQQAKDNGHLIFINSGRTFINIHPNLKALNFSGYCCGCGTEIYMGEEILYQFQLPKEACKEIGTYLLDHHISALLEGTDSLYCCGNIQQDRTLTEVEKDLGVIFQPVTSKEELDDVHFTKLVYWKSDYVDDAQVQAFLSKWFTIIDRGNGMREVVPKNHSKATAIEYLCKHFNIPLERCYALGDSTNDLAMLEYVPHAIAMGNSMEEILPYAEYQTDTVEEDGVVKALRHYHLI